MTDRIELSACTSIMVGKKASMDGATYIYINVWNRKILFRQDKSLDKECLNTLYDLIKADLIEKVDD